MVLTDIGSRIAGALKKMTEATVIDQAVIDDLLKEICNALINADVNTKLVLEVRGNLKKTLAIEAMGAGLNRRNAIRQAVFQELCRLLDPGKDAYKPVKGKTNIIIFVGLQGNGKTTTIGKYASFYKRKGFKPALVCADTFRAGAYDQLLQNAALAKVSFYGSRTERDPVKIASEGVERLKKDPEGFDMIIVDTSGRHKQESALFTEMEQIVEAIKPDQIVFVMDGSIGQAAHDQALAFKKAVKVGAVIVTKLDGNNAKGGGALSAVAATQSPIIFLGTGEHLDNLEPFEPEPFVSKLLGWGDWKGVVDIISNAVSKDSKTEELAKHLQEGKFSLRDMYSQFETMLNMGPLNQLMEKLPGMGQLMAGKGDEGTKKIKTFLIIMDSMTDEELDDSAVLEKNTSRIERIARGSGRPVREVNELLAQHKMFKGLVSSPMMSGLTGAKPKGGKGMPKNIQQMAKNPQQMAQMAQMLPPDLLKQMGGAGNLNQLMKQMGNLGNMGNLAQMFGGGK